MKFSILRSCLHLWLVLAAALTVNHADAEVSFSSMDYDFGVIHEEEGPVTGRVTMVNLGPGPTYIRNVRTTCGCTGASFAEGMIEEGDSTVVSFTYDPDRRPGNFDKHVKVFVGQDNKMHVIRIKGKVMASRRTIAANFPDSIGDLHMSTKVIDGGELVSGESRNYFVTLYNPLDHPVRPTVNSDSEAITMAIEPAVLEPGATGVIGIYLNTRRDPAPGEHVYDIDLCTDADGTFSDMGQIRLQATLK